mmetsp:Transcript_35421/g.114221  ORF Transcript_35421/g.114221 Transcript_35421/m.114221 type:complete len:219 (-) Transcript_35421:374-1030(-)
MRARSSRVFHASRSLWSGVSRKLPRRLLRRPMRCACGPRAPHRAVRARPAARLRRLLRRPLPREVLAELHKPLPRVGRLPHWASLCAEQPVARPFVRIQVPQPARVDAAEGARRVVEVEPGVRPPLHDGAEGARRLLLGVALGATPREAALGVAARHARVPASERVARDHVRPDREHVRLDEAVLAPPAEARLVAPARGEDALVPARRRSEQSRHRQC